MVQVESFRLGLVSVVEGKKTVVPIETSHLICATANVYQSLTGYELVKVQT